MDTTPMHKKQSLNVTNDWQIMRNEFYDIDPLDDSSEEDKSMLIFDQEDMLWIRKDDYSIDVGWVGGDMQRPESGYCLVMFRGGHWQSCELLEMFRSKRKEEIVRKLNALIAAIDKGVYKTVQGYAVDANNANHIEDWFVYSATSPGYSRLT